MTTARHNCLIILSVRVGDFNLIKGGTVTLWIYKHKEYNLRLNQMPKFNRLPKNGSYLLPRHTDEINRLND